uniref:Serine palmitoyltransferase small subunit B n=1 Tax=Haemonchus contortus TaxID=6289 RepID=A0A7I4YLB4_HAECO
MSDPVTRPREIKTVHGLEWLYLQYCLVTGLYMLEPWERKLFTCVAVLSVSIVAALVLYAGKVLSF